VKIVIAVMVAVGLTASIHATDRASRQQVTLLETLQRQIAGREGLIWSSSRRLTWEDFKGSIAGAAADEAAHLEYGLFYGVRCTGRTLEFRVLTAMIPADSWVRRQAIESAVDSARTLQHEQTHFDLAEVHARRMRRYFDGLYEPCLRADADLAALADGLIKAQSAEQKRYDDETRNGRRADAQKAWETDVAARLAAAGPLAWNRAESGRRNTASPARCSSWTFWAFSALSGLLDFPGPRSSPWTS
jgi:hypothetical protein